MISFDGKHYEGSRVCIREEVCSRSIQRLVALVITSLLSTPPRVPPENG
jgi:hypothetical protein